MKFTALLFTAVALIPGFSASAAAASRPEMLSLSICLSGDIPDFNLVATQASLVFHRIGIDTHWRGLNGCPPDAIHVRALKSAPATLSSHVLGCAHPLEGRDAEVYLDRISAASGPGQNTRNALLGYVIAHEVVHLLEGGSTQHADEGVMRARWNSMDVDRMLWSLELTPRDIDLIRQGLKDRQRLRISAPASAVSGLE